MAARRAELERFSERLSGGAVMEALGPFERQVRWELSDRAGSSRTIALRSGSPPPAYGRISPQMVYAHPASLPAVSGYGAKAPASPWCW